MEEDAKALARCKAKKKILPQKTPKRGMKKHQEEAHKDLVRRNLYRWEALRRSEAYRGAYQAAFEAMEARLKREMVFSSDDYDGETDRNNIYAMILDPSWRDRKFHEQWTPERLEGEFITSPEGRSLAVKCGLVMPFPPHNPPWVSKFAKDQPIFYDTFPVIATSIEQPRVDPKTNSMIWPSSHLENKRYLNLKIDLTCPKEQVMVFVERWVDKYRHEVSGDSKGKRAIAHDDEINPFLVWDMVQNEHKTKWQVAKKLIPQQEIRTAYDKIRQLFKKAQKLIAEQGKLLK
ncbi:hypothetical protein [Desulfobacca acetoxidans]